MISIIIPAFNEANSIGEMLRDIFGHPKVSEIIVVDDGSSDATSEVARNFAQEHPGIKIIQLEENVGKADAMNRGVQAAENKFIMFMDADVLGYTHEKMSLIMNPVIDGIFEMFVGLRMRKAKLLNDYLHFFPILGGERALTKTLWNTVPRDQKNHFKIEIALNYASKKTEKKMGFRHIPGLTHIRKEQKYGFWIGFWRRLRMCWQVFSISFYLYIFLNVKNLFKRDVVNL